MSHTLIDLILLPFRALRQSADRHRDLTEKRRRQGLCVQCGAAEPLDENGSCASCRAMDMYP